MVGRTISHYKIVEEIGAGGMGAVYRAEDLRLKRTVALKFLAGEALASPEHKARLLREAQAAASLDDSNICTVYEIDEDSGETFIAMAYLEGESLESKIRAGPMPLDTVVELAKQIAQGLQAAHRKGVVHRDIKPANVIVTPDGVAKIVDFGLAQLRGESRLTREGVAMGTTAYMSPEQAMAEPVDNRTDIWSLGVVIYEMLTGQTPFRGHYGDAIVYSIVNEEPQAIEELREGVPAGLQRMVGKALAKSADERYEDIDGLLNELGADTPADVEETASSREEGAPVGRGRLLTLAGAACLIALIGLGAWFRSGEVAEPLVLPAGPVIAVLPFANMSGDPAQEFFADGISDEVITALTRFDEIFVLARNTTFQFKDRAVDVRRVGEELGARYVLEGSVRRAEDRVRVTAQLLDAEAGTSLWAETYDRDLSTQEIFGVMNDITSRVVGSIADVHGVIMRSEGRRADRSGPSDLEAYECVLRAQQYWSEFTAGLHAEVSGCLDRAIESQPNYADAHAWQSLLASDEFRFGFNLRPGPLERAMTAAREAVRLAPDSELAHEAMAYGLYYSDDLSAFFEAVERAYELNPNNPQVIASLGLHLVYAGRVERGLAMIEKAAALNPQHPTWYHVPAMYDRYHKGDYEGALAAVKKWTAVDSLWQPAWLTAIHGQLGRDADAGRARARLLELYPDFPKTARENYRRWFKSPADGLDRFVEGLRKAGVEVTPE